MEFAKTINFIIMILFFVCYSYQMVYIPIAWISKKKAKDTSKRGRFAVLIAARNEESVIGGLIDSLKNQNYPEDMIDIYVVADNCSDNTSVVAEKHGAIVFERFNDVEIGKGYALNFLLKQIENYGKAKYDAYMVFDADNIVDPNFVSEMNKSFMSGCEVITCYRNSKNYGDNWISAGYALWFLRESKYLNMSRYGIGSSCAVSGTGFLFSDKVLKECGGWNFFCLTEDIEFTIHNVVNGRKIGYCHNAVIYDEQPTAFSQSWRQRKRWAKGFLQVFAKYGKSLFTGIFKGSFSCFDMTMNIMPATALTLIGMIANIMALALNITNATAVKTILYSLLGSIENIYITVFITGIITVITEWKKIYCPTFKKILYMFTFPIFMLTYIPIFISAIFTKVEWKQIEHTKNVNLSSICRIKQTDLDSKN